MNTFAISLVGWDVLLTILIALVFIVVTINYMLLRDVEKDLGNLRRDLNLAQAIVASSIQEASELRGRVMAYHESSQMLNAVLDQLRRLEKRGM